MAIYFISYEEMPTRNDHKRDVNARNETIPGESSTRQVGLDALLVNYRQNHRRLFWFGDIIWPESMYSLRKWN